MVAVSEQLNAIKAAIDLGLKRLEQEEAPRNHLGCSLLGHHCDRWIWLSFRHAVKEDFSGRMLRLFRRGHDEEKKVIEDLRRAGATIEEESRQARVRFGSFVEGGCDGIISSGLPGQIEPWLLEVKTSNKDRFAELVKGGVQKANFQHWVQMQLYMLGLGLKRALYYCVRKDDDETHLEIVEYNEEAARAFVARGHWLALLEKMPDPCPNGSPTWYKCKWCPAYRICWQEEPAVEINCRTCCHSTPKEAGAFFCEKNERETHAPCESHTMHPDLVPWPLVGSDGDWTAVFSVNGEDVANGERGTTSEQLIEAARLSRAKR